MLTTKFFRFIAVVATAYLLTPALHSQQRPDSFKYSISAPPVGIQPGARLGSSVAIDGAFTIVGAPEDDLGAKDAGAVKVFDTTTGALVHVLPNPSPMQGDNFGNSVAISGSHVLVGAFHDDAGEPDAGTVYLYDLGSETPTVPVLVLSNPDPDMNDSFGKSVAISGERIVVGAHYNNNGAPKTGSAYVFDLLSETPTSPIAVFHNPDSFSDFFGNSVAISGTRVVVGAYVDDTLAENAGSAYVYDLAAENPTVPIAILNNPDPESNDAFGVSVAILDTRVVIGASSDNTDAADAGRAYVYDLASGTPTVPVLALNNPVPESGDSFGNSVAISGMRVVVGAWYDDVGASDSGTVYVFDLSNAVPTVPVKTLNNPAPSTEDQFGVSVAISGTTVAVGAWNDDMGAEDAGSAYIYNLGAADIPIALNNPGPSAHDKFGRSVAISGQRIVVGAAHDSPFSTEIGRAYVYSLTEGTLMGSPVALHGMHPGDHFGYSVAVSGARVVVGAPQANVGTTGSGRAYVYDLSGATPTVPVAIIENPEPQSYANFGASVAIAGTKLVVTSPNYDSSGTANSGRAYIYDLEGGSPAQPPVVLINPNLEPENQFGWSVAISGTRILVGAPGDNGGGRTYVYDFENVTITEPVHTLTNPSPSVGDGFGRSVAISGSRVVVGSPTDDAGAFNTGGAYVYDLSTEAPEIPVAILNNPEPQNLDFFGSSVAISGTRVLIGVRSEDTGEIDAGSAYLYDLMSSAPSLPVAMLNNPDPEYQALFGDAVAIEGELAVIGVPNDASPEGDKGSISIFGPDTTTQAPILISPVPMAISSAPVEVAFALPEAALPGSVRLTFAGTTTNVLMFADSKTTKGTHSVSFDPKNPLSNPNIVSGGAIPDGTYNVTLSYQDATGNAATTATSSDVTIDTANPQISNVPADFLVTTTSSTGAVVDYLMPTATDNVALSSFSTSQSSGTIFPLGLTTVTFTAKDTAGNEAFASFTVAVRLAAPLATTLFKEGDNVPGGGEIDGPPADAKLSTFGVPAIDADGHVAFSAKWVSDEGNGSGIFRDDTFVAKVGGAVPGLSGAMFKSFTEPVIDAGHVAFLATAAGVPKVKASVLVSDVSGTLEKVAQSGVSAPGAGEATFKSFKSIAVSGATVGALAQLTPGTGSTRTTAANDLGLWVKEGASPLVLALREGQEVAPGKKIKTLVSFAGGNGSPGQGRGWLIDTGDGAWVLALTTLSDKSQAIVAVALDDLANPTILVQSGTSSSFASLGLPATNASAQTAFLGSLVLGGEVTKANSRGIFANLDGSGTYSTVVRVSKPASSVDVTLGLLKDPVFAADGGIAFSATLRGSTVKGPAAQTIWWQPPGGELTLLAHGGAGATPVADIPGAQWKSFPSLAIAANRGPLFTGTLVPGKGGVTKATSNGLWATDFEGNLRLLVQSGVTQIDGKTVKSFTLLNANVGSQGSTRSFNDNAFVVWRATFTDKSQAIIKTEVP